MPKDIIWDYSPLGEDEDEGWYVHPSIDPSIQIAIIPPGPDAERMARSISAFPAIHNAMLEAHRRVDLAVVAGGGLDLKTQVEEALIEAELE